ncbi:hypothetical protein KV205_28980 [Streptomyces sp. SKN60]|uniref:hypothetical protein n=1 Tax=Streptomyces sp. SKN60 TaxID=2855506 RepID=UPI002246D92C|nr:hypothetical protein [Streptomyces sp. SKN60]MCX2184536.1 hypothetical protein [Streptomyces sp. SKN60]
MRRSAFGAVLVLTAFALGGLTACSSTDPGPDAGPGGAAAPTKSTPTAPVRVEDGFMPDLVGGSVMSAYGQLSGSMRFEDVSGQGRIVPTDSGAAEEWKVCTQTPAAGAAISAGQEMVIGAVKKAEDC